MTPIVLTIAGSDSSGGAGIQADLKTACALGVYGESVVTALTAQNTLGVQGVAATDPVFITAQMDSVFADIVPQAVKIGMLPTAEAVCAVAAGLRRHGASHIVLDPVMVATSGDALSEDAAVQALARELLGLCEVATPNIPEAEVLSGQVIESRADMERAGEAICARGCAAVLVKGGHFAGQAADVLCRAGEAPTWFEAARVATENTHGTGCTLSSAIACFLARGLPLEGAVRQAKDYLTGALSHDLGLGKGHGPVNHLWAIGATGRPPGRSFWAQR